MKLETFFEHFDLLTDAPNAAAKLREIILQLAVQGKLERQNIKDESISVLINQIEARKKEITKLKGIKEIKVAPVDSSFKPPFEIPSHWRWTRLGEISQKLGAGSTPLGGRNVYTESGIKFLRSQNVWNDGLRLASVAYISPKIHQKMSGTSIEPGDILLNITGASIGRSAIVPEAFDEANVSQHVSIIRLVDKSIRHYVHLCIISSLIQTKIAEVQVGISREGLSMTRLKDFPLPLPPLAEQKRIVEKVDRLLVFCDAIDKHQQQRQQNLLTINDTALAQLLAAPTPDDFQHHWQGLCNNFDLLYSTPETIPKLRQAILQLGFSGKLTKPESGDDEVNELFENIKSARSKLLKETRFRDPQNLKGEIQDEELIFEIPKYWVWSRIGHIFLISSGTTPNRLNHSYFENGTEYWVKTTDLNNDLVLSCEEKITKQAVIDCNLKYYPPGTVCVALYGGAGTIGKSGLLGIETTINQSVCGIYPNQHVEPKYLHLYLKLIRPLWMNFAASLRKAPNINAGVVNNMIFPLPPLAEQKRIVAKVDSLLSLCDALEAKLKAVRDSSATLMDIAARQIVMTEGA